MVSAVKDKGQLVAVGLKELRYKKAPEKTELKHLGWLEMGRGRRRRVMIAHHCHKSQLSREFTRDSASFP